MSTFKFAIVTKGGNTVSQHKTLKAAEREMKTQLNRMRRVASYSKKDSSVLAEAGKDIFNRIVDLDAAEETAKKDEQKGFSDRKAGCYDKWYRYNRADNGAAYDRGCVRATAEDCPENFTLIEANSSARKVL